MNRQGVSQGMLLVVSTVIAAVFVSALGFGCLSGLTRHTTALVHYGICGPPNGFGLHLQGAYVTGWLAMAMPVSIVALLVSVIWAAVGRKKANR